MTRPADDIRLHDAQLAPLAALVHELRPEWDEAGIRAVLRRRFETLDLGDLALVAITVANDRSNRTPGPIAFTKPRTGAQASNGPPHVRDLPDLAPRQPADPLLVEHLTFGVRATLRRHTWNRQASNEEPLPHNEDPLP